MRAHAHVHAHTDEFEVVLWGARGARYAGYRKDLKYPILFGVAAILDGEISPREGLVLLMEKYPLRLEEFPF